MYVRASFEYKNCIRQNGIALFCTWTFSDTFIPVKFGRYCFDKKLMQRYLNKCNTYLMRKFHYSLKYMVFSEVGHVGTHRPHHHGLFFIYPETRLNVSKVISPSRPSFQCSTWNIIDVIRLVTQLWPYGMTDIREVDPSKGGIKYVTKYCAKDVEEEAIMADIVSKIRQRYDKRRFNISVANYYDNHMADSLRYFCNRYMPFYMVSNGVGSTAPITRDMLIQGKPVNIDGFDYAIPSYYVSREVRETIKRASGDRIIYSKIPCPTFTSPKRYKIIDNRLLSSELSKELNLSAQRKEYIHQHQLEIFKLRLSSVCQSIRDTFGYDYDMLALEKYDGVIDCYTRDELDMFDDMLRAQSQLRSDVRIKKRTIDRKRKIAEKAYYNRFVRPIEDVVKTSRYGTLFGNQRNKKLSVTTPYQTFIEKNL